MQTKTKTNIKTQAAHKYVAQLCKHFNHKAPSTFEIDHEMVTANGTTNFKMGKCQYDAKDNCLTIIGNADTREGCEAIQSVIDAHIIKFAHRESLNYKWQITE